MGVGRGLVNSLNKRCQEGKNEDVTEKVRVKAEAGLATVRIFSASEVATLMCIDVKTDRYTFLIFYSSIKFLLEDASSFKPGKKKKAHF